MFFVTLDAPGYGRSRVVTWRRPCITPAPARTDAPMCHAAHVGTEGRPHVLFKRRGNGPSDVFEMFETEGEDFLQGPLQARRHGPTLVTPRTKGRPRLPPSGIPQPERFRTQAPAGTVRLAVSGLSPLPFRRARGEKCQHLRVQGQGRWSRDTTWLHRTGDIQACLTQQNILQWRQNVPAPLCTSPLAQHGSYLMSIARISTQRVLNELLH